MILALLLYVLMCYVSLYTIDGVLVVANKYLPGAHRRKQSPVVTFREATTAIVAVVIISVPAYLMVDLIAYLYY